MQDTYCPRCRIVCKTWFDRNEKFEPDNAFGHFHEHIECPKCKRSSHRVVREQCKKAPSRLSDEILEMWWNPPHGIWADPRNEKEDWAPGGKIKILIEMIKDYGRKPYPIIKKES